MRPLVAAMQQIADWLKKLGMAEYSERFAENRISLSVLPDLTDQHLEKLGVALGDRLKILRAIRELSATTVAAQPAPSAAPVVQDGAERRQLTVMFCDLVGSTALSARLDPEDLRAIIGSYHRCCADVIINSGGFVAKYMGDGVLAYFGYPQAHEEDAERAVRAGLALVEAVPKLDGHGGTALQVRVGIATGLVVVGDLLGEGAAQEQAVVGETPNLAARLQALAGPGAVVIASSTRRLTRGLFEYRDLGTVALKGFAENVPAWQVLGASGTESRFEALRAATTPLVGRDEEIELLIRRWEQAKRGDGQVVLISGEPGIGKSRIAQTIVERLGGEPHVRLRYFCSPHHQDSALYPSIAQLERAAGFRRDDTPEQRLEKLEAVLAQGTNDLSEAAPLLAALLSVPTGQRYPPLGLTPQKRKERTLHAQVAQVEGLSAREPVLMVFEDVHWSDPTTRESLDLLVDRIPTLRVLLIITFRSEFTPPWIGRPHVTMLTLNHLPRPQRTEMIACVTGGKALPKEISDEIIDRTDGVPLFIEELTKTVIESGILVEAGDHYMVTGPVTPMAIPTTLHGSLLARLDRLSPIREVAQVAAAIGRQFSHQLISAVAAMPQMHLDDAMAQLVRAELIYQRGMPPDAEYTFKHALVQDAAYGTLLRSRRQRLHARIVATLENHFPEIPATQPALLARHCTESGLIEKAGAYRLKAGELALSRSAIVEAEAQFRKGLSDIAMLPDSPERQRIELEFQLALSTALMATHGYASPGVAEALGRARRLCEGLDQPAQFSTVLGGECTYHLLRAELLLASRASDELLKLGAAWNSAPIKLASCLYTGSIVFHLGDFTGTRSWMERALALCDLTPPSFYSTWLTDPKVWAHTFSFRSIYYLGHFEQARLRFHKAMMQARQRSHPYSLAYMLGIGLWCDVHIQLGPEALQKKADRLAAVCREQCFPHWLALAAFHRGSSLVRLGRTDEGLAIQAEALASYRNTGTALDLSSLFNSLADSYRLARRPMEGLRQLEEAVRHIEVTQERWCEAETHRVRGQLLDALGDSTAAETSFHQALTVARNQNAKLWELRAATSLAHLWRDRGKHTEAHDLLAPVYNWFTEGFDAPVLQDAKALLAQLT
jgi:class 3 adenylate cyclase/tetratricopeptide (TPR) repeat protein